MRSIAHVRGENRKKPFQKVTDLMTTQVLELIHSDVCGMMPIASHQGSKYFVTFIDDFSRRARVYFIKNKSEVLSCFKHFVSISENQTGKQIKILRTDNGTEYKNTEFSNFLVKKGIQHQLTNIYTPQQNGVAERYNRTLLDLARSMLADAGMPKMFWAEAVNCANYLRNRCYTSCRSLVPEEIWTGKKPSVKHLKPFGCRAYVHVPKQLRNKLDDRATLCVLVGYSSQVKGYRLWSVKEKKIVVSRDVKFDENEFDYNSIVQISESKNETGNEWVQIDDISGRKRSNEPLIPCYTEEHKNVEEVNRNERIQLRDRNTLKRPDFYVATSNVKQNDEPQSYEDAVGSKEKDLWEEAMNEEYNALMKMNVWDLVELPKGRRAIGCKWVYKIKRNADGSIERYKARLVAKGFTQSQGIDYDETYSPVANLTSIRLMLTVAVKRGWKIHQMDVKTAYLNGHLREEIYMKQPNGYMQKGSEHMVCKLNRSLYGLKQSGRSWNETLDNKFKKSGLIRSNTDSCIYYRRIGPDLEIVVVYVDDLILISPTEVSMVELKQLISSCFEVKDMGPLHFLMGIEFERYNNSLLMNQTKYIESILEEFNMKECHPVSTPIVFGTELSKRQCPQEESDKRKMSQVPYRQLIGKLIYLVQGTRPDLAFSVAKLGQFSSNPGESHWTAAKRVLRYLKGTKY